MANHGTEKASKPVRGRRGPCGASASCYGAPMSRPGFALMWLLCCACGGGSEAASAAEASSGAEAAATAPTAPAPPPPLPAPVEGTFAFPVRVPLPIIAGLIDAALPQHESQGYQAFTQPGRSPAIEARYELWRDPVHVRFSQSTLHIEVPVRYAARFNARIKSPFGGKWMTVARDEPWGTEREPLRITLHLRTRIDISPRWKLSLETRVEPPVHGPPPSGKLCTGGAFKLCVTKASIAPEVDKRLDAELLGRLGKAAADFDRQAVKRVSLRARVQRVYRELVQPQPAEHGRWMTLEPTAAALSLRAEGNAVVVEPALGARLRYHESKPATTAPPLPDRGPPSGLPDIRHDVPAAFIPPELQMLLQAL